MNMIETEVLDSGLCVYLNRPEVHNAFNPEVIKQITQIFKKNIKNYRFVILKGRGPSFCAGADLSWMQSMVKFTKAQNLKDSQNLWEMFNSIYNCPVPVITYVHGNVFAGGLGLVSASDIVLAESNTKFCFSEPKLGIVPAVISQFVEKKMNSSDMRELFLTADIFDTQRALSSGLIQFVGTIQECEEKQKQILKSILKNGPLAVQKTKKLLNSLKEKSEKSKKSFTTRLIAEVRTSSEGQEGIQSFLQKRKPKWMEN